MAWLLHGGGRDAVNNLHNQYDMAFVGWWIPGPESLASTKPIRTAADFKDWKFRSPPGLATKVFAALGASPIVMDFNEIFTALETGIIDGADAANLTNNVGLGLYDIAEHTNFPGFHSMPADHLSCNKAVWDAMPAHRKKIMEVAMDSLALHNATINEVQNAQTAKDLRAKGINLYEWAPEDLQAYRDAVQIGWTEFATTPEAKEMLASHIAFLKVTSCPTTCPKFWAIRSNTMTNAPPIWWKCRPMRGSLVGANALVQAMLRWQTRASLRKSSNRWFWAWIPWTAT